MTLSEKIGYVIGKKSWSRLPVLLNSLTNSELRRAEVLVREDLLDSLSNDDFWECYLHFVMFRPQGFLPCIINIRRYSEDGSLSFDNDSVRTLNEQLSSANKGKLCGMALPHLHDISHIDKLLDAFGFTTPSSRVSLLARVSTPQSYYMLFQALHDMDDNHDLCLKCCRFIMQKHDDLSFNMASILREYFGLHEIQSQLSLSVAHYELSYIASSFENFRYVLEGRRPKI